MLVVVVVRLDDKVLGRCRLLWCLVWCRSQNMVNATYDACALLRAPAHGYTTYAGAVGVKSLHINSQHAGHGCL